MTMLHRKGCGPGRAVVSFRLPPEAAGAGAVVAGEFNDWSLTATPMAPDPEQPGWLVAHVELTVGRRYRFRYILDGRRWINDWQADDYEHNAHGGEASVIDLTRRTADAF